MSDNDATCSLTEVKTTKSFLLRITILAMFISSVPCQQKFLAQVSEPLPDKKVGAAEVYYFKDKNKSRAQVRIYLQGRPEDITAKKDIVSMDVIFEAPGLKLTKPKYATFAFSVYSAEKSKYSENHNMQIYIRGIEGVSRAEWRTRLLMTKPLSTGGTLEIFLSPSLKYERIERMANAGEVMVTIGDSRFALKNQDLQALRDLNQTIDK